MVGQRSRRRVRKRRRPGENSKMKFVAVIGIMIMAVLLGYLTAKFVIGPILGYNADESPIKIAGDDSKETSQDDAEVSTTAPEEGYALQFGVFSTKEAADAMVASLQEKGIETEVIEADNMYKVISPVIKTKDEALTKLDEVKNQAVEDVFIASF